MMPLFQVHLGFELPFWLALPTGPLEIFDGKEMHRFNLSNSVNRVDVGDYFLGKGNVGRTWIDAEGAEDLRAHRQRENPDMPITRHQAKTVLTYVREIECADVNGVNETLRANGDAWYELALRLTNRLIDAYVVLAPSAQGQSGAVAEWDLGHLIVSVWSIASDGSARQLGGRQMFLRDELPLPELIAPELQDLIRIALRDGTPFSVVDLAHSGARSQIMRGRYRNAVVDDVTALELEVLNGVERRLADKLPASILDDLLRRESFDNLARWLEELGGPPLRKDRCWSSVVKARRLRQDIVHKGAQATKSDAEWVHSAAEECINLIKRWRIGPSSGAES